VQICVRYGLAIGGVCAPLVYGLMILFAPIAYPIAMLLDYILGKDEGHTCVTSHHDSLCIDGRLTCVDRYKKAELKSFLQFHREGEEPLRDDEASRVESSRVTPSDITVVLSPRAGFLEGY
jgi:metal transporter CNNM